MAAGFVCAATLLLLELALRLLGLAHPVLYEKDAATGYRLKPNQHVTYGGVRIDVNDGGVRDPRSTDRLMARPNRVLVLGDSVTWGGVRMPQDALFTSRLEAALGTTVINAGVNGYSVSQMVALYRAHLTGLDPSLIVVYLIPADFHRPPVTRLVRSSAAFPLRKPWFATTQALAIVRILAHSRFGWAWLAPPPIAKPTESLPDPARILRNLDALLSLANECGSERMVVVVSPRSDDPRSPVLPEAVGRRLAAEGITVMDLSESIPPEQRLFVDIVHLSAEGHAAVADALAEKIAEVPGFAPAADDPVTLR